MLIQTTLKGLALRPQLVSEQPPDPLARGGHAVRAYGR